MEMTRMQKCAYEKKKQWKVICTATSSPQLHLVLVALIG